MITCCSRSASRRPRLSSPRSAAASVAASVRGVADAVREAGKRVPEDIALVGFDNWEVIAAANRPPLTTVDMNLRELGRTAGEELLSAIEGRPSSGLRRLPCSLVLRESSRPRQIQGQPVSA